MRARAAKNDLDHGRRRTRDGREFGLLQPISLMLPDDHTTEGKRYRIFAYERRFRAFCLLAADDPQKYRCIRATVMRVVGENKNAQVSMMALIEKVVREIDPAVAANAVRPVRRC